MDPESIRREVSAGAFSVDLVAGNDRGETVIIENQLDRSDHDHLGKLLTHAAAFDAESTSGSLGILMAPESKLGVWPRVL